MTAKDISKAKSQARIGTDEAEYERLLRPFRDQISTSMTRKLRGKMRRYDTLQQMLKQA